MRRARAVFARVWCALESRSGPTGRVRVAVLLAGVSVLTSCAASLKVSETFALFDANGDGLVDFDEMTRYFFAVFTVKREMDPNAFLGRFGGDPTELPSLAQLAAFRPRPLLPLNKARAGVFRDLKERYNTTRRVLGSHSFFSVQRADARSRRRNTIRKTVVLNNA